ncbi:sensor histidine kinase [Flavobacterium sp.]|uniref:tetratricopeptide repeat-containing sensor histidine kinase n=1 Tax=Flavobacterium sp. TaxID=239 RepID=UPI00286DE2C7|nr:sensor histidine kinase [Flavobacterium sp.]
MKTKTDSVTYYLDVKKPIKAINYLKIKTDNLLKNKQYDAYCENVITKSELYFKFNDAENAIKILFKALTIADKNNLLKYQILLNHKIGVLYSSLLLHDKAYIYFKKAEKIALAYKNEVLLSRVYTALFIINQTKETDSVKFYLDKAIYYSRNSKDFEQKQKICTSYSGYYLGNNELKLSKKYCDSSLYYALKSKNINLIGNSKNALAYYHLVAEKDYAKAEKILLEALEIGPEKYEQRYLSNIYQNISYAYEKQNNFKKALEYNNKYYEIFDQLMTSKMGKVNQEVEIKYAINKVENEYKNKEKIISGKQERNQKLLLIFVSLFILAGLIFYFYYQNLLLKQRNKVKEIDNKLQYKIISATLDGQDQERTKISEVLHDNVSAILSSVGLHLSAFESTLNLDQINELKKTKALLKEAHDKVRDLSHELVPQLLVKLGLQYALKDICEKNTNSIITFDFNSTLKKDRRYDSDFETKVYYIISELLNNTIKHSKASKSKIKLEETNNQLTITIFDNGKGFDINSISVSNGFGLTQIKARIKNLNGIFTINSKINQGTLVVIKLSV